MKRAPLRRWTIVAALSLLPAAIYWNTIFQRYGFRDDYAILRESHNEPGKVTQVCAAQARPLFGWLAEHSFAQLRGIDDFPWLRLLSALLLGLASAAMFRLLRAAKWDRTTALLVAAVLVVLPGAQLLVSWTVAWPLNVALLLALAAFACGERAFGQGAIGLPRRPVPVGSAAARETRSRRAARSVAMGWRKAGWWSVAVLLVAASALIYPSDALFYFVAVAASVWPRRRWVPRTAAEWLIRHALTVALGLGVAFAVMMNVFARGAVPTSERVMLEHDWPAKLSWFVHGPLQNALATIVLNTDGSRLAHRAALLVALVLLAGTLREGQTRGWRHGMWWLGALGVLLVGSFGVNLLVADRWPVYRVLLPLTGVVVVFLAVSFLMLGGRKLARWSLAALFVVGASLAHRQAFDLIAWPQSVELALLEQGARQVPRDSSARVFVVTPTPEDHVASRVFCDEFGSLSTDSDWVPKEMLNDVLFDGRLASSAGLSPAQYASGREPPSNGTRDVVIDLRRVRDFRDLPKRRRVDDAMLAEALTSR